jgi:hypothetical protein
LWSNGGIDETFDLAVTIFQIVLTFREDKSGQVCVEVTSKPKYWFSVLVGYIKRLLS